MVKIRLMIALLLMLPLSVAVADGGELSHRVNGEYVPDQRDIQDTTREHACDCCQKCQAARKPVEPDLQKESVEKEKNGCRDCCERCGRPVQPLPEDIPPEIIQKPKAR